MKDKSKQYNKEHREERRAYDKDRYWNKGKREYDKKYKKTHKEQYKEYNKQYSINHREELKENKKIWNNSHREQVKAYDFWREFEGGRFDEKSLARVELKVDNAFRRAIDIKENILRSLDLDHSINEDILKNVIGFVSTQLKDLTDDHYKIQNIFKDIKANIILKQME